MTPLIRAAAPWAVGLALLGNAALASRGADSVATTPPADVERVLSAARAENRVMDHLDVLSNRIGPRLTGSHGLQDACDWAVERFQSFGIANARLERWGEFPVGFERGPWSGRMVEPASKPLTFNTNAWTAGTHGPQRGPALLAPTNAEQLEAIKSKLPGAYILAGVDPAIRINTPFRQQREAAYAEAKIAGLIRPTRGDLIVTGGNYRQDPDKLPTTPAIDLVKAEYDELVGLVKDGKPVVLEFDIRNHFRRGPIPLSNVIAEIPGTEHPDEYVVVGGHIDSWDGATGTTDNGTGCATTLEAARLLMASGVKPKRTIMFQLWSGEEEGLLGSRAYIAAHKDLLPRISAVLVHDGGTNYLSGITATAAMRADFDAVFAPVLKLNEAMPFAVTEVAGLRRGIGSDHDSYLAAGVPGFFWRQGGKAVYNHTHHTQYDTFDAAIPEYQKHSAVVAAVGALGIANLDHLLSREKLVATGPTPNRPGANASPRRTIGVALDESTVVEVTEGGLAEKAGIKAGDKIVRIGDRSVESSTEVAEALQAGGPEVTIHLLRDGKPVEVKVTFAPPAP